MWKWIKALNPFESDNYHPWMREELEATRREGRRVQALLAERSAEVEQLRTGWDMSHKAEEEAAELRAQLSQAEIELADKAFYVREFAAVSHERDKLTAERDAIRERAAVAPTDDQVEALARVFSDVCEGGIRESHNTYMRRLARAAIAHLATRPEGLPTADEFNTHFACIDRGLFEHEVIELIYDYLRPWLRDPVGCELDVTAEDALRVYARNHKSISGMQAVLDLCRSRIRPVYECKECAKWEAEIDRVRNWNVKLNTIVETVRVALENRDNG